MYNLTQVAQILRTPPGTLRKYIDQYGRFLSEEAAVSGATRRFTREDLVVLGRIRKYKTEQKTDGEIQVLLKKPGGLFGGLLDRINQGD